MIGATTVKPRTLGDREFILLMAFVSALSALAIDMLLPAFADMREAFGLSSDATDLSLTITLFFVGSGVGQLFYGPLADAIGRKPVLAASLMLYGVAALVAAFAPSLAVLYGTRFVWGVAAAGPRSLSQAIVRDRYAGDAMARVMTLIQAAFFVAPILAPIIGKGLVTIGSWRWVMGFGVVSAALVALWAMRLEETLDPANRRPLRLDSTFAGFGIVVRDRQTMGYLMAVGFAMGAFFSFLASAELVFESVFDRASWFVPYFSGMSVLYAGVALASSRLLRRMAAYRLALLAGAGLLATSTVFLLVALSTGGVPPFALFLVLFTTANACHIVFFPTGNSLALEPMGALAGTAAAVLGFITSLMGAGLAALIDRAIDGTVTPMALGYTIYAAIGLAFQFWARGGRERTESP